MNRHTHSSYISLGAVHYVADIDIVFVMDDLPITNNHQLQFLYLQEHGNGTENTTIQSEKDEKCKINNLQLRKKYLVENSNLSLQNQAGVSNESIKSKIWKTFATNFQYCWIFGFVFFISGILLSVIAFHGLHSSKFTPIMGKFNLN